MLIVLALSDETLRLNTLRARLPGVSSGVLDHHVAQMVARGLLSRQRFREMPPRVEVSLTQCGLDLLPLAAALARWGMRHEWEMPEEVEHAHADAVLRQLPALIEEVPDELTDCVLETVVEREEPDPCARLWFGLAEGRLRLIDEPNDKATARIVRIGGDEAAWIAALGPDRDYAALSLEGDRKVAQRLFELLPRDNRL